MPFQILVTLKDRSLKEDLRIYFGSVPRPGEMVTLEIDGRVMRVRVTGIGGEASRKPSASQMYRLFAVEI